MGHGRKRKKKGGKQRKDLHTDKESEREREKDLRPRASSQHVMKVRFFRRCNLHRFRFRSLWQNVGPPALQLMRATSKTPESGEDRKPGEQRDLRPKIKKKKKQCCCESLTTRVCLDEHVCVSASRDSGGLKLLSLETNLLEAVNALIVARLWFFPPPSVFASLFIHFFFFFWF